MKGSKCPICSKATFHLNKEKGTMPECSSCHTIIYRPVDKIANVGSGKGNICSNCDKQTLHKVSQLQTGQVIRICTTCTTFMILQPDAPMA